MERIQGRSQRLFTRITTDKQVKSKALELFSAAQSSFSARWNDPNNPSRGNIE